MKYFIFSFLIIIFLIILFPIILVSDSLEKTTFDESFYVAQFNELGVYDNFPDNDQVSINLINTQVITYLKGSNPALPRSFFNQKEIDHMLDVKVLFNKLFALKYGGVALFVILSAILYFLKPNFFKSLNGVFLGGSILTLILIAAGFFMLVNFDSSFTKFHNVFFEEGSWTFDADSENIVNLYPFQFFLNIFQRIVIIIFLNSIIFMMLSLFFIRSNNLAKNRI
ncbi:TIGR01906 family membrane protein [Candidatus Woesearchaeota archaeon]|jgi:integral membrane protein (TIGR01906 family)|nr:TIGR01906 family membrane protein [Candidatus Woesearchaeota archaeon]